MTAMAGRSVAGVAAGLALVVSLAGCRANGGKSEAARSAAPRGGTPTSAAPLTAAQVLEQVSQKAAGLTSLRGTISIAGATKGMRGATKGDLRLRLKPALAMRLDARTTSGRAHEDMSEILLGDHVYLNIPGMKDETGKSWAAYSLSDLSGANGVDPKTVDGQGHQGDPALHSRLLTASKDVHAVGTDLVGGVSTTHYKGTFAFEDALAGLDADERSQANGVFGEFDLNKLTFDVWIDGQQLPRKLTLATPPGARSKLTETLVYRDFNVPITIKAPPADDVMDGKEFMGGGADIPDVPV